MKLKPYWLLSLASLFCLNVIGQNTKEPETEPPLFGLRYHGILTAELLSGGAVSEIENGVSLGYAPSYSQGIGAYLKLSPFTRFSFVTGISTVRRTYQLDINADSAVFDRSLRVNAYQIPLLGAVNVQIADEAWLSAEGGPVIDFFPSNQSVINEEFAVASILYSWLRPSLRIGAGYSQFIEKFGGFYLGASYQRMLLPMSRLYLDYSLTTPDISVNYPLSGHFFSLDIGYFFAQRQ